MQKGEVKYMFKSLSEETSPSVVVIWCHMCVH